MGLLCAAKSQRIDLIAAHYYTQAAYLDACVSNGLGGRPKVNGRLPAETIQSLASGFSCLDQLPLTKVVTSKIQ